MTENVRQSNGKWQPEIVKRPHAITFSEIEAWSRLNRRLEPWEIAAITELDARCMKHWERPIDKVPMQKASQATITELFGSMLAEHPKRDKRK